MRLTPLPNAPVKVIRGVLGELAGHLPLVIIHVEIAGARQAEDPIYGGRRGGPVLRLLGGNSFRVSSKLLPAPAHHSPPHPTRRRSRPCGHTSGGTRHSGHRDT